MPAHVTHVSTYISKADTDRAFTSKLFSRTATANKRTYEESFVRSIRSWRRHGHFLIPFPFVSEFRSIFVTFLPFLFQAQNRVISNTNRCLLWKRRKQEDNWTGSELRLAWKLYWGKEDGPAFLFEGFTCKPRSNDQTLSTQRKMAKFKVLWRTWTHGGEFSYRYLYLNAVPKTSGRIQLPDSSPHHTNCGTS